MQGVANDLSYISFVVLQIANDLSLLCLCIFWVSMRKNDAIEGGGAYDAIEGGGFFFS